MATSYPQFAPPGSRVGSSSLSQSIPGFSNMTGSATNNIQAMLSGMPSASTAKRANAYFGVNSGMPSSDFVRNRGFDLYNQQGDAYQQQGFDNFLKLLGGFSGTVAPTVGQEIQQSQFDRELAFKEKQAEEDRKLQNRQLAMKSGGARNRIPSGTYRLPGQQSYGFGTQNLPMFNPATGGISY